MADQEAGARASSQPPKYSMITRVKTAKEEQSKIGFIKALPGIFLGTIGCTICLGVLLAIPIAMIAIGAVYLKDCPVERFIPIYLVVAGACALFPNVMGILQSIFIKKDSDQQPSTLMKMCSLLESLVSCFMFAWFIAGNVWIYGTYGKWSEDESLDNYCHPTLYWFAFWITTAGYILLGVVIIFACVIMCCAMCCAARG